VLILLQHACSQSIYYKLYLYNLFTSKIVLAQTKITYINYREKLLSVASFKYYKLITLSSNYYKLNIAVYQSFSYNYTLITL
jgi:hypothetical protein